VSGTPGADLAGGLGARPSDLYLCKPRWSAFFATPLDDELRERGVRRLAVAGVDLSRCVRATATDALSLDYEVHLLTGTVATRDEEALSANLADLRDLGVRVEEAA
jgi:nicotinamidase-related amidase